MRVEARRIPVALLLAYLCAVSAVAQDTPASKVATKPISAPPATTTRVNSAVQIPRVTAPPSLQDFEDMQPHGAATQLRDIGTFTQEEPTDGAAPTQKTHAYIGYDSNDLYVVWVCFDTDASKLRAHLNRREDIFDDDYVQVTLDTFHDERHALVFASNPMGVQADGLWTEGSGNNPDTSWDTVWYTKSRLMPQGYIVWEAIPFRSLRFHVSPQQIWGVTLLRVIARENEFDYWPRVSSRVSGLLNQEGTMLGFREISPHRNMEFNPYVSAQSFHALDLRDTINPRFSNRTFQGRAGFDSKFVFADKLVLDTTVNPDFSQVESDEPQNTINQRFEVFFPEKRPFFLENSNFFEAESFNGGFALTRLLFTRRIADPEFGLRLTGKVGPWNIGLLSADDRSPGKIVSDNDPLHGTRAYFNIARITHDIGQHSNIGMIFTDREYQGTFNRVGGLDTTIKINKNWDGYARAVVSSTQTSDSGYLFGTDGEARVIGSGRRFTSVTVYQDITPNFRTEPGFLRRTDIRHFMDYFHFYFRPEGKHFVFWGPELTFERMWDHQGTGLMYTANGDVVFFFKPNIIIAPIAGTESDTLRPQDFTGLPANRKFTQNFGGLVFRGSLSRHFTWQLQFIRSGAIDIVVPAGQLPVEGDETSAQAILTYHPIAPLSIQNTYILDRVVHNLIGHASFDNHIFRTKWNYQITRELSLRFIGQYNNLLANPQYSALETTRTLNFDFLITYLWHPGTAVYVGYNSNLENVDPGLCARLAGTTECDPNGTGLLRTPNGLVNDGRLFFVKVAYLFRP
jgi:hypothetical protein